ncbi:Alpha/Beta hydrolase protein [Phakopsora pachyrhizi]|uniref:Alpha/Beta hydrolase protein n=1 Tax=Phakopsora pachyrhizi TaxID=170000 RepID=A0AAV0BML5_PHAPC|nr:Alpha/Beta hydrolase protein [Phakopsora pachyrhizi]
MKTERLDIGWRLSNQIKDGAKSGQIVKRAKFEAPAGQTTTIRGIHRHQRSTATGHSQQQRHQRPTGGPATAIGLTDPRSPVKNQPETTQTIQPTHRTTLICLWFNNNKPNNKQTTTTTTHQHPHSHPQHQPTTTSTHPQLSAKDNVILLHIGLSASSHAKSHDLNKSFGLWEKFIGHGPNYPIDLDRYFVICKNFLGSCYGSTGPSSINPETNEPMGPISQSSQSLTRVGSSMGGMQSIVIAWLKPQRAQRMVSISGCERTGPSSIALQYAQRSAVMDSRTSLKPINDSNNVQNQSLRVKARGPLKDNRRSGKLLTEETLEEWLAQGLSTRGTSEDPGQTVGLDNRCKQSPETDWYGCDSIQQTLLSQEDQKDEDPVK